MEKTEARVFLVIGPVQTGRGSGRFYLNKSRL